MFRFRKATSTPRPSWDTACKPGVCAPDEPGIINAWSLGQRLAGLDNSATPTATDLSGDQLARRLGAGLDFDQLRAYQPGEPAAMIDWRLSMRAGEPLVREYRKPAQRQLHLILEDTPAMWFATRKQLKRSLMLLCAHLLSAAGVQQNLAVRLHPMGGIDPRHSGLETTSKATLLARLDQWQQCRQPTQVPTDWAGLTARLLQQRPSGSLLAVVADLNGPQWELNSAWTALAQQHRLLIFGLYDPAEVKLPDIGTVSLADGQGQPVGVIDTHRGHTNRELQRWHKRRYDTLADLATAFGGLFLPLDTRTDVDALFARLQHLLLSGAPVINGEGQNA